MARDEQAMTSERLAEVRRLSYHQEKYMAGEMGPTDGLDIDLALHDLLAEVERLRAREAALVAVVRAVAGYDVPLWTDEEDQDFMADLDNHWPCIIKTEGLTGRRYHEGPCIIEQARALLASADGQEGGGDGA